MDNERDIVDPVDAPFDLETFVDDLGALIGFRTEVCRHPGEFTTSGVAAHASRPYLAHNAIDAGDVHVLMSNPVACGAHGNDEWVAVDSIEPYYRLVRAIAAMR